jgi:hypothetical protein
MAFVAWKVETDDDMGVPNLERNHKMHGPFWKWSFGLQIEAT